ncbi:hypothetical protein B0J17DRAFT_342518 [Rhizoctonia solani]|nr:hypothetical protein B0J17DRAFT_342518 [Rhizoctonia solani]
MNVDLEQRKAQIVRRWSKHVTMVDNDDIHAQEEQRQPRPDASSGPIHSQSRKDESSVSPSRPQHSPTTSPTFTGGASLATVSSVSTSSSTPPGSTSSGGSGSVRTPTDHTHTAPVRSSGHQHQGSEATVRPTTQEKGRRVMVGMSPYGVPIYREVRQDEPDSALHLVGTNPIGRNKDKDKIVPGGKSEGGGGLGWLLSPQAKAEKRPLKFRLK